MENGTTLLYILNMPGTEIAYMSFKISFLPCNGRNGCGRVSVYMPLLGVREVK